jgi:hypothetical protein
LYRPALLPCLTAVLLLLPTAQASRGAHAGEVLSVLNSLWDATDVPDQERSHFVRMMSGPLRLHAASLEKVRGAWAIQLNADVAALQGGKKEQWGQSGHACIAQSHRLWRVGGYHLARYISKASPYTLRVCLLG